MNFFHTLIRPDREEHPERAEIARAANLLQIGEFQLLQLAYSEWFGKDLAPRDTDRLFTAYMMQGQVPAWGRHYARHILALDAAGMLDDRDPDYHRYDADYRTRVPAGVRRFCIAATAVSLSIFGALWIGYLTGMTATSILPPYFNENEITPRG